MVSKLGLAGGPGFKSSFCNLISMFIRKSIMDSDSPRAWVWDHMCWNYGSLLEWWLYYWNGGYTIEKVTHYWNGGYTIEKVAHYWNGGYTIGMVTILLK